MTARELFEIQLALEAKRATGEGEIVRAPGDEPDGIPRVMVASLDGTSRLFTSRELPAAATAAFLRLSPDDVLSDPSVVAALLPGAVPRWFRSHTVPPGHPLPEPADVLPLTREDEERLRTSFDPELADFVARRPVYASLIDGRVVGACVSVRENSDAAECWVVTDPAHRRRGHGRRVVSAWARACHAAARIAFYSYEEENKPSAALARSLALPEWCRMVAFD